MQKCISLIINRFFKSYFLKLSIDLFTFSRNLFLFLSVSSLFIGGAGFLIHISAIYYWEYHPILQYVLLHFLSPLACIP